MARRRTRQQVTPGERHRRYMVEWRQRDDNLNDEYRQRVMRRIAKGAIPNVKSMIMYNITLDMINEMRNLHGLEPIIMNVPMFLNMRETELGEGRAGENIPAQSEVILDNREVTSRRERSASPVARREPTPEPDDVPIAQLVQQRRDDIGKYTGSLKADDINIYMRHNPTQATRTRVGVVSDATIERKWGKPFVSSPKVGFFAKFMEHLGQTYVANVSLAFTDAGIKHVKKKLYEQRLNPVTKAGKFKGKSKFKSLEATMMEFVTLLQVMQYYPAFDIHKPDANRQYKKAYNIFNRLWTEMKAKVRLINDRDKEDARPVLQWDDLVALVKAKYPDPISKENLYISLYSQFPSRDDWGSMWIDDGEGEVPRKEEEYDLVRRNTLFLPNKKRKYLRGKAFLVMTNYKTSKIYGARVFVFDKPTTDNILKYVKKNRISGSTERMSPYLFGASKMSGYVGRLLDDLGVDRLRLGAINYLRKSYISTQLANFTGTDEERLNLAYTMKHSPSASLRYVRELLEREPQFRLDNMTAEQIEELENMREEDA